MQTFSTYLKRHGLKLWLANLLGTMATSTITFLIGFILFSIAFMTGIFTLISIDFSANDTPEQILSKFQTNAAASSLGIIVFFLSLLFLSILSFLAGLFQVAAQYVVVDETIKIDRVSLVNYFVKGLKHTWRMFLLFIMSSLLSLPIFAIIGFAIYLAITQYSDITLLIISIGLILLALLLFLLLGIALLYAPYILVAENMGAMDSILLSIRIFLKKFWQVLLTCLLIWFVSIGYAVFGVLLYFPVFFSFFDPTGILATILSMGITITEFVYTFLGLPLIMAINSLIVGYRYHKHLRPHILPDGGIGGNEQEPLFTFK